MNVFENILPCDIVLSVGEHDIEVWQEGQDCVRVLSTYDGTMIDVWHFCETPNLYYALNRATERRNEITKENALQTRES